MALNFADLFEHAADVFAERTAVACGDRQVTYRELDQRTNRLAHHLAELGVGPGDQVGLYARNSVEAVETLIASCKLRAAAVNINYHYVENELHYMLADCDLTALVYDRRLAPLVAAAAPAASGLRGAVVIDDGSDAAPVAATEYVATEYVAALAAGSPVRDFPARSNDDVYIIYTGGTTGYPKGVMWRHEDIWRTLGGGIDFVTGVPLADEWGQSRKGLEMGEFVKLCAAPLIHGNAQVAALAGLFAGETIVLLPAFDPGEIWRAVQRHRVCPGGHVQLTFNKANKVHLYGSMNSQRKPWVKSFARAVNPLRLSGLSYIHFIGLETRNLQSGSDLGKLSG